jgi:hypothetical protein
MAQAVGLELKAPEAEARAPVGREALQELDRVWET